MTKGILAHAEYHVAMGLKNDDGGVHGVVGIWGVLAKRVRIISGATDQLNPE